MYNNGISVEEACRSVPDQLSPQQQATCHGVATTSSYVQFNPLPVIAIFILVIIFVVVFVRKSR